MKRGRVTRKKPYDTIYDTPKRAKVQGVFKYLAAKGILYTNREITKFFGVEEGPGRNIVKEREASRTIRDALIYNK